MMLSSITSTAKSSARSADAESVVAHDVHDVVDGSPEGNFADGVTAVT